MRTAVARWTLCALPILAATTMTTCGSGGSDTFDPNCHWDGPTAPFTIAEAFVGLFHLDGRVVRRPARVWISQSGMQTELGLSDRLAADLILGGHQAEYLVMPPQRTGNLYVFHPLRAIILVFCGPPLHYRVEAEGCDPVEGDWTWNDNTYPERFDYSFHVAVRLSCRPYSGEDDPAPDDGGTPGDVPVLTRDGGESDR